MTHHWNDNRQIRSSRTWVLGVFAAAFVFTAAIRAEESVVVLKVRAVYVGDGRVISPGVVVVRDGRIVEVGGSAAVPPDAKVIELPDATVTPGLIDAKAVIDSYDLVPSRTASLRMEEPQLSTRLIAASPAGSSASADASSGSGPALPQAPDGEAPSSQGGLVPFVGREDAGAASETNHAHHVHIEVPEGSGYASADAHLAVGMADALRLPCCGMGVESAYASPTASGVRDGLSQGESSSEVIPHTRVLDAIDLSCPDLKRLLSQGVTTIYVGGDSDAVISSQAAVIRTGGPVDQRVVRPAADVMAVMGSDSIGGASWNRPPFGGNAEFYARRPTTRMGVAWVFRKAMYDAQRWQDKTPTHGADTPPDAAMPYLMAILKGEIPLRIQARMQHDIEAALRLTEEFKLKFTLEEATDAYRCLDALHARNVPVVYGPIYEEATGPRAWRGESQNARLHTFKALLDAGLTTALTAQELRDEDGLARQAMYAIRFGADPQRVLQAVTLTPAKLLRADKEIGSVETGKRADLVVWSGEPFAATTKPVLVMHGGRIESDRRVK